MIYVLCLFIHVYVSISGNVKIAQNRVRHFHTLVETLRYMGQDSLALKSKLSFGQFGTSA